MKYTINYYTPEHGIFISCECGWRHVFEEASVPLGFILEERDAHERRGHWETVGTAVVDVEGATLVTRVFKPPHHVTLDRVGMGQR